MESTVPSIKKSATYTRIGDQDRSSTTLGLDLVSCELVVTLPPQKATNSLFRLNTYTLDPIFVNIFFTKYCKCYKWKAKLSSSLKFLDNRKSDWKYAHLILVLYWIYASTFCNITVVNTVKLMAIFPNQEKWCLWIIYWFSSQQTAKSDKWFLL